MYIAIATQATTATVDPSQISLDRGNQLYGDTGSIAHCNFQKNKPRLNEEDLAFMIGRGGMELVRFRRSHATVKVETGNSIRFHPQALEQ
jgi:hypothetical protein